MKDRAYILMHKDIPVATFEYYDNKIHKLKRNMLNFEHLPIGCQMNDMKFHEWWKDRAVPHTRSGATKALRKLGYSNTEDMLINNLALSLTDCYWTKPLGSSLRWSDVSLFSNNFTDIFGEITFDSSQPIDLSDKSNFRYASSQGELQKKWCIDSSGRRFMIKGNWGESYQQSLNELFATKIHELQGFNHYTPYHLTQVNVEGGEKGIGCYSYNFCNEQAEFISAYELLNTRKIKTNSSWYNTLKDICITNLGFSEQYIDDFLGYQILTDYIISNTDRHMNNIGVLRNPDTLQYYGFAPIYDSGNSMFFREKTIPTGNLHKIETHSFLKYEIQMLKLVNNRNLVNLNRLPDKNIFIQIYKNDIPERHQRIESMYKAYTQKIMTIHRLQQGDNVWKQYK